MKIILNGDNSWEEIILMGDKAKKGKHDEGAERSETSHLYFFSSALTTTLTK